MREGSDDAFSFNRRRTARFHSPGAGCVRWWDMSLKSTAREVTREKKQQKSFANVLQSTGLSQLKPIQVVPRKIAPRARKKS